MLKIIQISFHMKYQSTHDKNKVSHNLRYRDVDIEQNFAFQNETFFQTKRRVQKMKGKLYSRCHKVITKEIFSKWVKIEKL